MTFFKKQNASLLRSAWGWGALGLLLALVVTAGSYSGTPAARFDVAQQPANCVPPPPGMVAWWPLDETSGTTVTDIVNGFNGTAQPGPIGPATGPGPTPTLPPSFPPGMVGSSLFFGSTRHIRVPHNPNLDPGTGSLAVDFWFIWGGGSGPIIQKMLPTGEGWGVFVVQTSPTTANVEVRWKFASGLTLPAATLAITANQWYHVYAAWTRSLPSNAIALLAFNGFSMNTGIGGNAVAPTETVATNADLLIGGDGVTPGALIAVDEVEIFSPPLTLQEVQALFNAGKAGKCKDFSRLCVTKFSDTDGDGVQDSGEPLLPGWQFSVTDQNNNPVGALTTNPPGTLPACLTVAAPGTYTVTEQVQSGWTPTTPNPQTVTVQPGQTANLTFGNQGKAEICIFKFNDLNGNGKHDPNEPLLGGWQFTVNPAPLPPTTSPVTTGPQGRICFEVAAPGTYTITEIVQPGWTPTTPNPQTVTVQPGQTANLTFGNKKKEEAKCDLKIEKKVQPSPLVSGQQATVTITVTNVGNAPCPGPTTVTETVPTGLTLVSASGPGWTCVGPVCTYPLPIPVNGSVSVTYTFNVTAPPETAIQNCATVSNPNDPNAANNRACITTPVVPKPGVCDREIKKTVSPNPVASGGTVTITITVKNVGTAPCPAVADVNVADPQPAGMTFKPPVLVTGTPPAAAAGWACSITPVGLLCTASNPLNPGNSVTITFTATVTAPGGSQVQNCAEVTNVGDANQANNKSCVVINVIRTLPPPDLALAKLLDGVLRAEQEATYVLRVTNVGGAPTTSTIRVVDPLPPQLRFISATGMGWSCSASGQNVICTSAGPIAPNQSSTIALRVRVAAGPGTQITNCAVVETEGDANPANNRGCHTGTVQR